MTKLIIDLSDALDEYHDDDAVVVWAPHHREGSRGQVVNTAQKRIRLTGGKAEQEVEPGPLMIRIQCRGISDTAPKDTVVPDQDSVTLPELLEQQFIYDPPVVSAAQRARNEAEVFAERAESGADRVGSAEQVGEWADESRVARGEAVSAAQTAVTSADNASASEKNAKASETNADDSASSASSSATAASTSAGNAKTSETNSKSFSDQAQSAKAAAETAQQKSETASGAAQSARDEVVSTATQVGQDRRHVDDVRTLLDQAYAESDAGQALPPRLTEAGLDESYARRSLLPLNVKDFGAVGDGIADDTGAIQAAIDALDPGQTLLVPHGSYMVTDTLDISDNSVKIVCQGTIVATTPGLLVVSITGDDVEAALRVDGKSIASVGVRVTGSRCVIHDGVFQNFHTETGSVFAVTAVTGAGVTVVRNLFRSLHAVSDGNTMTGEGAARAVFVYSSAAATGDTLIADNQIEKISGGEANAIHVQFGMPPFSEGRATISGNIISQVPRRAMKVQAAGTIVMDNVYRHGDAGDPGDSAAALISIIHSDACAVTGNTLDARYMMGIAVSGEAGRPAYDITISDNRITSGPKKVAIFFGDHVTSSTVSNNVLTGGLAGIWVTNVSDSTVSGNMFRGDTHGNVSMRILATCERVVVSGNTAFGGPRDWMIQNDAPGIVLENNHCRWKNGAGGGIRLASTAVDSVCRANSSTPGPAVYSGTDLPNMIVSQNRGNSNTWGGDVVWCRSDPAVELAGIRHHRGTVAFAYSPTAGGHVGWVCVSGGVPGVWKPFGPIDT